MVCSTDVQSFTTCTHVYVLKDRTTQLPDVIKLATEVISHINQDELLRYYGLKNDSRPDAASIKR